MYHIKIPVFQKMKRTKQKILTLPRKVKQIIVLILDVVLCVISVWLAFYLRLGFLVVLTGDAVRVILVSLILAIPIFASSGLYRYIFRHNGLQAMLSLGRAMLVYTVIFVAIFTFWSVEGVPRTVGLIQPILLTLFVGVSRLIARLMFGGNNNYDSRNRNLPQALIYGAGNAGRQLAQAIATGGEIRVVGFLDDDKYLHGNVLNGLPVYRPSDLPNILSRTVISHVLIALPSVSRQRRYEILSELKHHKLVVKTLPALSDIATGKVTMSDVRDLEIDDLLGREPVKPDEMLINRNTHGKVVMVTGAGGSVGSELCRQIIKAKPAQLLLVEISEFALFKIHQELLGILADGCHTLTQLSESSDKQNQMGANVEELLRPKIKIVPLLASVCDNQRINSIMNTWRPHTVYHAAAYKHVPMVEHNPVEGLRNNVWGTLVCAQAAMQNGARNFVLVSTDKAVRPTNIMGATKRIAELVLQALAELSINAEANRNPTHGRRTVFSMVRFGNVLGSSGSVVPMFLEQIKCGGPITLTHVDITRYFMTIPEAAQLVIQAGAMGEGGDVFVLDMGEPVKIIDLARKLVELSGLTVRDMLNPNGDIEIKVTGLRPGEKLYEELLIGDNREATKHPRIMKAHEQYLSFAQLEKKLNSLETAMQDNDVLSIRTLIQQLVIEYQPNSAIVDWVFLENQVRSDGFRHG